MANRLHQFLRNESQTNDGFKKKRGFAKPEPEEDEEDLPKTISVDQRTKLSKANETFSTQRNLRRESKTLKIPVSIDLVRIDFFSVFNLDLRKKFLEKYGLSVLEYTNYNKTVLFEITNEAELQLFVTHLSEAIASGPDETYENKPYNLISLIYSY